MNAFNLVIGAGSPLGNFLVEQLPQGKVVGFQRLEVNSDANRYHFCLGQSQENLASFEKVISQILEENICLIKIAYFREPPSGVNPGDYELDALEQLLNISRKYGKKISILFCSSISVYGATDNDPLTENCELNPQNNYARSKLSVEKYIQKNHEIGRIHSYIITRIPCLVGKGFRGNFLKNIVDAKANQKACDVSFIDSPFNSIIDFDTIKQLLECMNIGTTQFSEVLNIAAWPPTTLREVLDEAECLYNEVNNYPNPPKLIDVSRLKYLIGEVKSSKTIFREIL